MSKHVPFPPVVDEAMRTAEVGEIDPALVHEIPEDLTDYITVQLTQRDTFLLVALIEKNLNLGKPAYALLSKIQEACRE